jgi:hypothetical protein
MTASSEIVARGLLEQQSGEQTVGRCAAFLITYSGHDAGVRVERNRRER